MIRTSLAASVLFSLSLAPVAFSQGHAIHTPSGSPELRPYVEEVSELSSRARANVYFTNPQSIFNGVQVNFVNVGAGNLTFLRRDLVASGRIPIVLARVYDSNSAGSLELGTGWKFSAGESLVIAGGKAHLSAESGSVIDFIQDGGNQFRLEKN